MSSPHLRQLVYRWVMGVAELDDAKSQKAIQAIQEAGADGPGDHWRHELEYQAFQRCVENGGLAAPDIRATVLHAQLTATNLSQLEDDNGT